MAGPAVILDPLEVIRYGEVAKYLLLVGFTILVYDHLLTINYEITYIWRSKFGLPSVIFVVNRYLVPCLLIIDIYELFGVSGPHAALFCKVWTSLQSYLCVASYMSIHALVAMRVHALYGGLPWIRRTSLIAGTLFVITCIVITTMGQISVTPQMTSLNHQCVATIPPYAWTIWLPSIVFETYLFALTMVVAVSQLKDGRGISSLYMLFFRDGILYFVAVSMVTLFTLLVWAISPQPVLLLGRYFSLALVNVAGSRLVLNIKVYAAERDAYDNLGLPLSMPASEDSLVSPKMKFWRNRDKSQDQVESKSSDRDSAFVSLGYEDDEFWM